MFGSAGAGDSSPKAWQMATITGYILCTYALERSQRMALLQGWSRATPGSVKHRLSRCIQVLDAVAKFADLGNMCVFLYGGVYPHLLYRWSGLHMTPIVGQSPTTSSSSSSNNIANPPGYSAAQLYVKSRQLLWEVVSGLLAASALAVDWRGVLVQCRTIVVGLVGQVQTVHATVRRRVLGVVRQVVAVVVAGQRRWRRGLRSLPLVGGRFGGEGEESSGRSWWDEDEVVEGAETRWITAGGASSSSSSSSSSNSSGRPPFACALCGKSPPEAPHQSECGHPFCYLCLRSKVPLSTTPTRARVRGGGGVEDEGVSGRVDLAMMFKCPTCQAPATTCTRWSPQSY
jgi:hypothetical protein